MLTLWWLWAGACRSSCCIVKNSWDTRTDERGPTSSYRCCSISAENMSSRLWIAWTCGCVFGRRTAWECGVAERPGWLYRCSPWNQNQTTAHCISSWLPLCLLSWPSPEVGCLYVTLYSVVLCLSRSAGMHVWGCVNALAVTEGHGSRGLLKS